MPFDLRRAPRRLRQCISRRTDKLEWRANLTKSRGEAAVKVVGDRAKTFLWVVALASRTRNLGKRVADAKRRRAMLRWVLSRSPPTLSESRAQEARVLSELCRCVAGGLCRRVLRWSGTKNVACPKRLVG